MVTATRSSSTPYQSGVNRTTQVEAQTEGAPVAPEQAPQVVFNFDFAKAALRSIVSQYTTQAEASRVHKQLLATELGKRYLALNKEVAAIRKENGEILRALAMSKALNEPEEPAQ